MYTSHIDWARVLQNLWTVQVVTVPLLPCADEKYDVDLSEKKPFIKAVAIDYCQQHSAPAEEEEEA